LNRPEVLAGSGGRGSPQLFADLFEPFLPRHPIRPEFLEPVLLLAAEEGAVAAELAGEGTKRCQILCRKVERKVSR